VDFGQIIGLQIRDREPVFNPPPTVLLDVKLDADCIPRREVALHDFVLREEVHRLLERIDRLENGRLDRIEVRAGIPRRVLIETPLTEEGR
jgi:integrase